VAIEDEGIIDQEYVSLERGQKKAPVRLSDNILRNN
jgi:hypothetical protein